MAARGRLAPSPTGDLHLGGAATFLAAWLEARRRGGSVILRMEDLDPLRSSAASAERITEDLQWLGLSWDGAVLYQSQRTARYETALEVLAGAGLTYLCDCSRADIARVASAPHPGEEGPPYPGACSGFGMAPRAFKRPPAVRFAVPAGIVTFEDARRGRLTEDVRGTVGDFVLRRSDGVFAYQLAVVVDDLDAGVDHVVRGGDLLASTGRQVSLLAALGAAAPGYLHTPLVLMPDGARLAKRTAALSVRAHREAGTARDHLLGGLAAILGIADDDRPTTLRALERTYHPRRLLEGPSRLANSILSLPAHAEIR